ncbi:Ion-translocating oxidoreductase complex subunit G [Frankliniella fusca]|uniref:Ion-translocating oxidoreductase complex subunit G n=1 Tax=Frankliniella fusca TaxID=407009 RepID=A0AAE1I3N3_9NEOP|nr:Ion-translocating oxidoreductase complex subunit G [Frankliniella fusca]
MTAGLIIKACVVLHNKLVFNEENLPPHQLWYVRPRPDVPELPRMAVGENGADAVDNAYEIREQLTDFFLGPGRIEEQDRYIV